FGNGTYLSVPSSGAPIIGTQPLPQTVCNGSSATFTVSATSSNPGFSSAITYQWKDDGTSIPTATNATFTINSTNASLNGHSYTCAVTQCGVTTTSNGALL